MTTTTWDLAEFTTHANRLTEVGNEVAATTTKAHEAMDSNGKAFGILFGWAVTPALNAICGDVGGYADELGQAMSASAEGIKESARMYGLTEQDNIDRTRDVEAELETQKGKVQ